MLVKPLSPSSSHAMFKQTSRLTHNSVPQLMVSVIRGSDTKRFQLLEHASKETGSACVLERALLCGWVLSLSRARALFLTHSLLERPLPPPLPLFCCVRVWIKALTSSNLPQNGLEPQTLADSQMAPYSLYTCPA